jgi:hypothetical protein
MIEGVIYKATVSDKLDHHGNEGVLTYFCVQVSTGPLIRFLLSIHQFLVNRERCLRDR